MVRALGFFFSLLVPAVVFGQLQHRRPTPAAPASVSFAGHPGVPLVIEAAAKLREAGSRSGVGAARRSVVPSLVAARRLMELWEQGGDAAWLRAKEALALGMVLGGHGHVGRQEGGLTRMALNAPRGAQANWAREPRDVRMGRQRVPDVHQQRKKIRPFMIVWNPRAGRDWARTRWEIGAMATLTFWSHLWPWGAQLLLRLLLRLLLLLLL
jgi:hypothetical protein